MTLHLHTRVEEIARREAVVVSAEESLRNVSRRLWSESIGVVVVAGVAGRAAGILSERDVVKALALGADPDAAKARDIMTTNVVSVRPEDRLIDVVEPILDYGIRHVVVAAEDGRVVGVLSIRDVLRPSIIDALERGDARPNPTVRA